MIELADTSAWSKSRSAPAEIREAFDEQLKRGDIAVCPMTSLEILRMAKNAHEFTQRRQELDELVQCPIAAREWKRAIDVSHQLAKQGRHRGPKIPDLIIAAAAESAGIQIVHYDKDYDLIAEVTGQPTRWICPRGSLP